MTLEKGKASALLPLVVFLVLFIGTGAYLTWQKTDMAFYQLSAAVAVIPAIVIAVIQGKDALNTKINIFLKGVGEINIITMAAIYLLAGAFASVAGAIGGVTSTVNLGLSLVPPSFVLPGLFIIGAFISTAMGTSMGTVAAIAPIALGVGQQTDLGLPLLMGVVVAGAMFGDNLSMISDTTIAATRTQNCEMRDKFILNATIAIPTALLTVVLFYIMGVGGVSVEYGDYEIIKVIPYIAILVMAVAGINVFVVLLAGIVFSGLVGICTVDNYTALSVAKDMYKGFVGMNEIMILSMMLGGLGELIKVNGGITWVIGKIDAIAQKSKSGHSTKVGEWCIAALVAFADICVANNTVAIILTGGVAKEIADKNGVDPRRSASILDMVSCVFQGILPYAAQLLLAGSIAAIPPMDVAMYNWYSILLGIAVIISISFGLPKASPKK